jgi:putative transcriptional regulator
VIHRKFFLFAAFVILLAAPLAQAQDLGKPMLLVATPHLAGPYVQTALLVVPSGDRHIGFILNRSTDMKLAELFPSHPPSAKVAEPLYFGGPEHANTLFAVVPRNPGGDAAMQLFGDLYITGNASVIDRIIEETPNDARYYAGFVGWQRGELADELKRGYWFVGEPDPRLVFRHDTGAMWNELVEQFGAKAPPPPGQQRS